MCAECPRPRLLPDAEFGVEAYLSCRTQWNLSPSGAAIGLRYEACLPMIRHQRRAWLDAGVADVPTQHQLVTYLQVIERAVLEALSEQRSEAPASLAEH